MDAVPWTTLEVIVFCSLVIACIAATMFPFLFALRAPWWKSALGMAQLLSSSVLAITLWLSALLTMLRHGGVELSEEIGAAIAVAIFLAIAFAKTCLTLVMLRIQTEREERERT